MPAADTPLCILATAAVNLVRLQPFHFSSDHSEGLLGQALPRCSSGSLRFLCCADNREAPDSYTPPSCVLSVQYNFI